MKLFSDREACGTAAGPVGTVSEYAAGNTAGKPGMSKGSDITVNPDNDNFGEHAVTRKSEVANTAVSYTTGKSEVAAKNLTKETGMEALIKGAQEMQRKRRPRMEISVCKLEGTPRTAGTGNKKAEEKQRSPT